MRRLNARILIVGVALMVLAGGFFLGMSAMAPKSNDPVEMMRTVGQVAGAVGGLGLVMAIFGLIGKRRN
jgi:hypothetical protein